MTLAAYPVVAYATAVTEGAMCIVELKLVAPGPVGGCAPVALYFRLGRGDAGALGRALLDSADLATRLATAPSLLGREQ